METINPSDKYCARGHSTCGKCVEAMNITVCPVCSEEFIVLDEISLKKLRETLPRLCCYYKVGCEHIFEPGDDHSTFCGYRPISCRHLNCSEAVQVCKMLDHCKIKHNGDNLITAERRKMYWPDFDPQSENIKSIPVFLFDVFFYLILVNDVQEKQLKVTLHSFPDGKPVNEYFVKVRFEKIEHLYSYTIKARVVTTSECSPDDIDSTENNSSQYCMTVPQDSLSNFMVDNKLRYSMAFFKLSK